MALIKPTLEDIHELAITEVEPERLLQPLLPREVARIFGVWAVAMESIRDNDYKPRAVKSPRDEPFTANRNEQLLFEVSHQLKLKNFADRRQIEQIDNFLAYAQQQSEKGGAFYPFELTSYMKQVGYADAYPFHTFEVGEGSHQYALSNRYVPFVRQYRSDDQRFRSVIELHEVAKLNPLADTVAYVADRKIPIIEHAPISPENITLAQPTPAHSAR